MGIVKKSIPLYFCAILISICSTGCKEKTVRQQNRLFDYQQIELENGLDVITLEDFSCPIVTVQLWYHVGSKNENPDRQGFAHMFEHMMFRGTDRLGPTDHFKLIRNVGGTTNGYTGFDRTVYLETIPADQLELALWLEAERMSFLNIDQQSFNTERKVVEEERRMGLNEPYGSALEKILDQLYDVHPYRWPPIGNIAHLRAASVPELREFWQRCYVPSNATLIIVGAINHEQAQQKAKSYFGWIPRYDEPPKVTIKEPAPEGPHSIVIIEDNAPAPLIGVIYRTVPISHKDTVALDITANVLGEGNSSRLYRRLVAEKQLAVAAEAFTWSLEQDGMFAAGALLPADTNDPNLVLDMVEKQIQKLRKEPVTDKEITKAKNQMLRYIVTKNLTVASKAKMLGQAAVEIGDASFVNKQMDDIRDVTTGDITRVANKYLTPERCLKGKIIQASTEKLAEKKDEEADIISPTEQNSPKPGRPGLTRPKDFPKQPPVREITPAKILPGYSSKILNNGLKLIVVPNHEVPFITVRLGLLNGAWTESKPGTASMTLKMLTKGTESYTEAQLAEELDTYAITLHGNARMDTAAVNMSCLTEHIQKAMSLLTEVVTQPTFPLSEFEKLRKQVRTSLEIACAEPEYLADKEFRQRLYGNHPYSRTTTGEIDDVDALVLEDLKQWWKKFARPDHAILIVSGDIDQPMALEIIQKTLGNWQNPEQKSNIKLPEITSQTETQIFLVDKPGCIQSQIRVGLQGITRHHKHYFTSRIVSNYFGWGFDSRLNKDIRVDRGLTYSIWGSYIAHRFAGEFEVATFTKTDSTAEIVKAVIEQINQLKTKGPTQQELQSSKDYWIGSFARHRETPQQVAEDLWLIESQQLGSDYLERLLAGVAETGPDNCEDLLQNTIETSKLVIIVVGQAEKLKKELEQIAPVTIVSN